MGVLSPHLRRKYRCILYIDDITARRFACNICEIRRKEKQKMYAGPEK